MPHQRPDIGERDQRHDRSETMAVPVAYEVFALKAPASSDNEIHGDSVARS